MRRNRAWEPSGGLTEPGTGQREAADAISVFPSHTTGTDTSFKQYLEVTFLKPKELHFNHWSALEPRILKFFPLLASSKWTLRFGKPQIVHVFPLSRRNLSLDLLGKEEGRMHQITPFLWTHLAAPHLHSRGLEPLAVRSPPHPCFSQEGPWCDWCAAVRFWAMSLAGWTVLLGFYLSGKKRERDDVFANALKSRHSQTHGFYFKIPQTRVSCYTGLPCTHL